MTGATGFCGAAVAEQLVADGHEVVALGRRPAKVGEYRHWDASTDTPDLSDVDAVVHLAAAVGDPTSPDDTVRFEATNIGGTERLLAAADGRPTVVVSSASVYDPRLDRSHVTEDHPTEGGHRNAYGRTKAVADRMALDAGAVVLRPRAVYADGDPHLLPRLRRAVRGGQLLLPGPDVEMSLTHVANLATACVAALEWEPGPYNIADAGPYQRDETLSEVLGAMLGRPIRIHHVSITATHGAAVFAGAAARLLGRQPLLTPYAIDAVSQPCVLDIRRALATGWTPERAMAEYLAELD